MKRYEFMLRIWWLNIGNKGAMCGMHIKAKTVVYRELKSCKSFLHQRTNTIIVKLPLWIHSFHYSDGDVIMGATASEITSLTIVYSAVHSG